MIVNLVYMRVSEMMPFMYLSRVHKSSYNIILTVERIATPYFRNQRYAC